MRIPLHYLMFFFHVIGCLICNDYLNHIGVLYIYNYSTCSYIDTYCSAWLVQRSSWACIYIYIYVGTDCTCIHVCLYIHVCMSVGIFIYVHVCIYCKLCMIVLLVHAYRVHFPPIALSHMQRSTLVLWVVQYKWRLWGLPCKWWGGKTSQLLLVYLPSLTPLSIAAEVVCN